MIIYDLEDGIEVEINGVIIPVKLGDDITAVISHVAELLGVPVWLLSRSREVLGDGQVPRDLRIKAAAILRELSGESNVWPNKQMIIAKALLEVRNEAKRTQHKKG